MRIEPLHLIRGHAGPVHPVSRTLEEDLLEFAGHCAGETFQRLAEEEITTLICPIHQQKAAITISVSGYVESSEAFEGDYQLAACCAEFENTIADYLRLR